MCLMSECVCLCVSVCLHVKRDRAMIAEKHMQSAIMTAAIRRQVARKRLTPVLIGDVYF